MSAKNLKSSMLHIKYNELSTVDKFTNISWKNTLKSVWCAIKDHYLPLSYLEWRLVSGKRTIRFVRQLDVVRPELKVQAVRLVKFLK